MMDLNHPKRALALATAAVTLVVAAFVMPVAFGQSPTTTSPTATTTSCPTTSTSATTATATTATSTPAGTPTTTTSTTTYVAYQGTATTTPSCPTSGPTNMTEPTDTGFTGFPTDDTGGSPEGEGGAPALLLPMAALAVLAVALVIERRKR
ncbi:MAG: hypothetical protein HYT80_04265 [Euryarchaeota archaeon]|nr:hypothetical protein [Euryarchaeota archaeon]